MSKITGNIFQSNVIRTSVKPAQCPIENTFVFEPRINEDNKQKIIHSETIGNIIRTGEYDFETGIKTITETNEDGIILAVNTINTRTDYGERKEFYENGQLKLKMDTNGIRELYDEDGTPINEDDEYVVIESDKKKTIQAKPENKENEKFYNEDGKLENQIFNYKDTTRYYHYTPKGGISYIKETTPDTKIVTVSKNGERKTLVSVTHKKIDENHYKSKVNDTEYNILYTDKTITIQNTATNKTKVIDLKRLLKNIPDDKKEGYLNLIKAQNGEVLSDTADEISTIYSIEGEHYDGLYASDIDALFIENRPEIFAHELGHAMDFNLLTNTSSAARNKEFVDTYLEELYAYNEKGGPTIDFNDGKPMNNRHYASTTEMEMFAEIYSLLTTGWCGSEDCILQYFPKTLELAKKHIQTIRELPSYERH